jgi:predicted DCC family thiol-disulfide oxidoreductase YuxK
MEQLVVVYDSHCLFCSKFIQFVYENDQKEQIMFATFESEFYQGLLKANRIEHIDSILFVENGMVRKYSGAVLKIMLQINSYVFLSKICFLIPRFIRDTVYKYIARKRYWIFGESDQCLIFSKNRIII